MPKLQCVTCGGVYSPVCADGLAYFHTCPPLRRLRVQNLDGTFATVDPGTEGTRRVHGERFVPRPDARNENVVLDPTTGKGAPIAVGKGVTPIADNRVP